MSVHSSNSAAAPDEAASSIGMRATATSSPPPPPTLQGPLLSFNELVDQCTADQAASARRTCLTEADIDRVRISFSGQTVGSYVCRCLASVYLRVDQSEGGKQQQSAPVERRWRLTCRWGALVLMMPGLGPEDKFASSELHLVETNTCMPLWSLRVSSATQYSQTHLFFQTVTDPTGSTFYGLAFLDADSASEFSSRLSNRIQEMSEFECSSLKERRKSVREKERRSKSLRRLLSRSKSSSGNGGFSEISSPCICQHVASATVQDCDRLTEMLALTADLQVVDGCAGASATAAAADGSELTSL